MITFQRETLSIIKDEMLPLIDEHWSEVGCKHGGRQLDPDWDTIAKIEINGDVFVLTVRNNGVLEGYLVAITRPEIHCIGTMAAYVDLVFLSKKIRSFKNASNLFKYAEYELFSQGIDIIYFHVSVKRDFSKILKRKGYEMIETIWAKASK